MLQDLTLLSPKPIITLAPTRRQLLGSTAAVALLAGFMTTSVGRQAVAADTFSSDQKLTLLRVARDIYPHDEKFLDNGPYQAVIDGIIAEAGKDAKVADLVTKGLADLDGRANAIHKSNYMGVKSDNSREGLLRSIELTDFFQKIRGGLLFGLYNNKALYPKFGYDGSSWEKGGFINAGFDKIDWL